MIIRATLENFSRHHFNRDLARSDGLSGYNYGIEASILLTDIARNIIGIGKYRKEHQGWYHTSLDQLSSRHPYLSRSTIDRTLKKLRKDGALKVTDEYNRRKYDRTLWYNIPDAKILKLAGGDDGNISYIVNDAVEYGIEAAVLLSNVKYWTAHNMKNDPLYLYEYHPMSPTELSDRSLINLPMNPWTIRRALTVLVDGGALERKRNNRKGDASYLYRVVETRHSLVKQPDTDYPTECVEHEE